jgi:hypothetical protein
VHRDDLCKPEPSCATKNCGAIAAKTPIYSEFSDQEGHDVGCYRGRVDISESDRAIRDKRAWAIY